MLLELLVTMLMEHFVKGKNFCKTVPNLPKTIDKYPFVTYSE